MPTDDIVVLQDVRKSFGDAEVLKGIDMVCRRNETTCIVGGSGAGKTTLLRLIVALEKPTSGHIFIDGEDIVGMGERDINRVRMKFGMVYQYAALLDSINVLDNVAFPLVEHTKLRAAERRAKVLEKLRILGLDESALAKYPPILVLDEPTSGLDPLTSRAVDDLIEDTRRRFGVTSIVITHDIASCFRIAHQAILLDKGVMAARGSPEDLIHGGNEVAREFIRKSGVDVEKIRLARERA